MSYYDRAIDRGSGGHEILVPWFSVNCRIRMTSAHVREYVANQHHLVEPGAVYGAGPAAARTVTAVVDAVLLDDVTSAVPVGAVRLLEAFRGEWYVTWESAAGEFILLAKDPPEAPHALGTKDFRSWAVVAASAAELGLATSRTVRELVREDLLARGALMFHAGAARLADGWTMLLAGRAGTGKTSAAVRVAAAGGRAIGTDRTFAADDHGTWLAVGLPMSTRLDFGSANAMGIVAMMRGRSPYRATNPFDDQRPVRSGSPIPAVAKLSLGNAELHGLTGAGFVPAAAIDCVIILENGDVHAPVIRRLTPREASSRLSEHQLTPDPAYRTRWLSPDPAPELAEAGRPRRSALLDAVPAVELTWDPERHCNDSTTALFGQVRRYANQASAAPAGRKAALAQTSHFPLLF